MGARPSVLRAVNKPASSAFQHCPLNLARGGNNGPVTMQHHQFAPDFVPAVTEDMRQHEMRQKMMNPMAEVMAAAKAAPVAPPVRHHMPADAHAALIESMKLTTK